MARTRTQKQVAKRIDLFYPTRTHGIRKFRRALIGICALIAIAWIGFAAINSSGSKTPLNAMSLTSIQNPGALASPHAHFQNDCTKCHAGTEPGAFTLKVTDTACLTCHDAGIHRDNQKLAENEAGTSRELMIMGVKNKKHPFKMQSGQCIHCHMEHRGEAALLGRNDANCVICHKDLKNASADASIVPSSINVVTSFEPNKHPRFGRQLEDNGKWKDPTKLKFNHKFHFEKATELLDCTRCHSTQAPTTESIAARGDPADKVLPPFASGSVKPMTSGRNGDDGYMRPVSYAEHCSSCHPIKMDSGVTLSHVEMPLIRAQLADVSGVFRAKLAAMSEEDRKTALKGKAAAPAGGSGGRRRGAAAAAPAEAPDITPDDWVKQQLAKVKEEAGAFVETPVGQKLPQAAALAEANSAETPDPSVLEAFVAFGLGNNCAKCHDMNNGLLPGLIGKGSTTAPSGPVVVLNTEPTGVPTNERHWFANSKFNHNPHRTIKCVDCHESALKSGNDTATATMDVLSPDMDRFATKGNNCTDCHKPGGAEKLAATGSCVSCHVYHDRSKERKPDGMLTAKTDTPAPATESTEAAH